MNVARYGGVIICFPSLVICDSSFLVQMRTVILSTKHRRREIDKCLTHLRSEMRAEFVDL